MEPTQRAVPHFVERDRRSGHPSTVRLSDEIYGQVLDCIVITCVDLVLTHQDAVLLAQRRVYPHPSWWMIGGRMVAGESPLAAAQRKLSEEAGLAPVQPQRFQFIGPYSTCFARREQPPQTNGLHSLNLTYALELTAAEKGRLTLNPAEYASWQWCPMARAAKVLDASLLMTQVLVQILTQVQQLTPRF